MSNLTVATYVSLHCERKELIGKVPLQTGDELGATIRRLREIDSQLKEADAAVPRLTVSTESFYNSISNNLMQEMEVNAICTQLIISSWWASWLPFSWMHSLAASYYAKKALRIYKSRQ
jgi:hypothetical protein